MTIRFAGVATGVKNEAAAETVTASTGLAEMSMMAAAETAIGAVAMFEINWPRTATMPTSPSARRSAAPPLDSAGNSVRGQLAARLLSRRLGMDLFVSAPVFGE